MAAQAAAKVRKLCSGQSSLSIGRHGQGEAALQNTCLTSSKWQTRTGTPPRSMLRAGIVSTASPAISCVSRRRMCLQIPVML